MCLRRVFWHGRRFWDSMFPFLAQNVAYLNSSMLVTFFDPYKWHTNLSTLTIFSFGTPKLCDSFASVVEISGLVWTSFKAATLPLPTNALTVSQPVSACIPGNAEQTIRAKTVINAAETKVFQYMGCIWWFLHETHHVNYVSSSTWKHHPKDQRCELEVV